MDRHLLALTQKLQFEVADDPTPFHAALSLITNPFTSLPVLSSLLNSLILSLRDSFPHHPLILSLLSALSHHRPDFRPEISIALRTFALLPSTPTPSLAHSLSILFAITTPDADHGVGDEPAFLSLCFRPCKASLRHWLLRNANKFQLRPSVLITVTLGFTKDPYPLTRKAALDVLVWLCKSVVVEDQSMVQGCYFRATELLFDAEDAVRCSAVRAVSEWGLLLVSSNQDRRKIDWSDTLFVQLCSMARDMSMKVRLETFDALAKVGVVSEDILLQTLSKKASSATKEKNCPGQYTAKLLRLPSSSSAFALVHGLEDEFFEVRRSACFALRNLATLSAEFACEAVSLLMDMLNDDSVVVRLQALDTMYYMAVCDHLKVQEGHLHMLLGTLVDSSTLIRSTARRIIQFIKLHQFGAFKLCFEGLVRNLVLYQQDEADLLFSLFCTGRNHERFVVHLIQETLEEIEPSFGGTLAFERVRTVALLVLAITAPVSVEQSTCSIPPRIYSYAATLLGRICHSLAGHVKQNDLLSHLSESSQFSFVSDFEFFKGGGSVFPFMRRDMLLWEKTNGIPGSYSQKLSELEKVMHSIGEYPLEMHDDVVICTSNIFQKVHDVWQLIHGGFADEAFRILSIWKKELKALTCDSFEPTAESVFMLQYLDIIEMLGRVWMHCMFLLKPCSSGVGILEVLLGKLESALNEIRYTFLGLNNEQEVHILEIILVTYTLKMLNLKVCCPHVLLKKIKYVLSQVELLIQGSSVTLSSYVIALKKTLGEVGHSTDAALENRFLLQKSLQHYSLRQFVFQGRLVHVKANLNLSSNHENPLRYVSGLPVGIPCEITLSNIPSKSRVWLKMTLNEKLSEFVYLDLNELSGCDEKRKFTFVAPFCSTPKVTSFTLKVCIVLEYSSEHVCRSKFYRGPRGELIKLSQVKEVYLSVMIK